MRARQKQNVSPVIRAFCPIRISKKHANRGLSTTKDNGLPSRPGVA